MAICERCGKEDSGLTYHSGKKICISCNGELSIKANSRRIRFLALKRDNFKCRLCSKQAAEVRTIKGVEENMDNLITLCNDCIREREQSVNL